MPRNWGRGPGRGAPECPTGINLIPKPYPPPSRIPDTIGRIPTLIRPTVPESPTYDIFISHTPGQQPAARQLAEALSGLGVSCIAAPSGDDTAIPMELVRSKALLAWGSEDYFRSRPCQTRLAAAFIAQGRKPSAARRRVLLVNAEPGVKHIYPVHLRDLRFAIAPGQPDAADFTELAERLRAHCEGLSGTLEESASMSPPPWWTAHGGIPEPAHGFERRERELWDIHAALRMEQPELAQGDFGPLAVVSAIEGQGKSWLAREFAFRFGPAFPGGIFWLSAGEAKPAASVAELAENPALKMQLLAFLDALSPESPPRESDVPTLLEDLGELLKLAGQPFLWIVDDLPDGLNGPAFQQWLAPAGALGRTLFATRSRRYDGHGEAIHLPPLDAETAWRLLTREAPPTSGAERASTARLIEELGRHALAVTVGNAAAKADRRHRNTRYTTLRRRLKDPYRDVSVVAAHLQSGLPPGPEKNLSATLLAAIGSLGESGRDVLRLAAILSDAPLPTKFIADCLLGSGLYAEERRQNRLFARFARMIRRKRQPTDAEIALKHASEGIAALRRLSLGEHAEGYLSLHPLAIRAMRIADHGLERVAALRRAAVLALQPLAERCAAAGDWQPLAPFASHARALAADSREHPAWNPEDPPELACRSRLAGFMGDLDRAHGAPRQALEMYRHASAGLARAVAANAEAWDLLRDLAIARERIGDILAARGDLPGALDIYLKSLRIRKRLAGQDPSREDWQRDLWVIYLKAGEVLATSGDLEKARNSYRAALTVRSGLAEQIPADSGRESGLAAGFHALASLYRRAGNGEAALDALTPALEIYEKLAGEQADCVRSARALAEARSQKGDLLRERGDASEAVEWYGRTIAEYERLAALEPDTAEWRLGLALSHEQAGDLLASENPAGAAEHYRARLAIIERLIPRGAVDAKLQRDLALGHAKLGRAIEQSMGQPAALAYYRKAQAIAEQWADLAPEDTALREELSWMWERLGASDGAPGETP